MPSVGDWELGAHIGSGSFAVVWRAQHRVTGTVAAIKEIDLARLNSKLRRSLDGEISILTRISHPNVVKLLEVIEHGSRLYLVMEYCRGGDLARLIRRRGRAALPEPVVRRLLRQLSLGLRELSTRNLVHRDIKPQNLLLAEDLDDADIDAIVAAAGGGGAEGRGRASAARAPAAAASSCRLPVLKIADFGFARGLRPDLLAETLCGSPLYMAPEILRSRRYDARADLWSVGAVAYELLAGFPPFSGVNQVQLLRNVERGRIRRMAPQIEEALSDDCRDLLAGLLRRAPVARMSYAEFFAHPFVNPDAASSRGLEADAAAASQGREFGADPLLAAQSREFGADPLLAAQGRGLDAEPATAGPLAPARRASDAKPSRLSRLSSGVRDAALERAAEGRGVGGAESPSPASSAARPFAAPVPVPPSRTADSSGAPLPALLPATAPQAGALSRRLRGERSSGGALPQGPDAAAQLPAGSEAGPSWARRPHSAGSIGHLVDPTAGAAARGANGSAADRPPSAGDGPPRSPQPSSPSRPGQAPLQAASCSSSSTSLARPSPAWSLDRPAGPPNLAPRQRVQGFALAPRPGLADAGWGDARGGLDSRRASAPSLDPFALPSAALTQDRARGVRASSSFDGLPSTPSEAGRALGALAPEASPSYADDDLSSAPPLLTLPAAATATATTAPLSPDVPHPPGMAEASARSAPRAYSATSPFVPDPTGQSAGWARDRLGRAGPPGGVRHPPRQATWGSAAAWSLAEDRAAGLGRGGSAPPRQGQAGARAVWGGGPPSTWGRGAAGRGGSGAVWAGAAQRDAEGLGPVTSGVSAPVWGGWPGALAHAGRFLPEGPAEALGTAPGDAYRSGSRGAVGGADYRGDSGGSEFRAGSHDVASGSEFRDSSGASPLPFADVASQDIEAPRKHAGSRDEDDALRPSSLGRDASGERGFDTRPQDVASGSTDRRPSGGFEAPGLRPHLGHEDAQRRSPSGREDESGGSQLGSSHLGGSRGEFGSLSADARAEPLPTAAAAAPPAPPSVGPPSPTPSASSSSGSSTTSSSSAGSDDFVVVDADWAQDGERGAAGRAAGAVAAPGGGPCASAEAVGLASRSRPRERVKATIAAAGSSVGSGGALSRVASAALPAKTRAGNVSRVTRTIASSLTRTLAGRGRGSAPRGDADASGADEAVGSVRCGSPASAALTTRAASGSLGGAIGGALAGALSGALGAALGASPRRSSLLEERTSSGGRSGRSALGLGSSDGDAYGSRDDLFSALDRHGLARSRQRVGGADPAAFACAERESAAGSPASRPTSATARAAALGVSPFQASLPTGSLPGALGSPSPSATLAPARSGLGSLGRSPGSALLAVLSPPPFSSAPATSLRTSLDFVAAASATAAAAARGAGLGASSRRARAEALAVGVVALRELWRLAAQGRADAAEAGALVDALEVIAEDLASPGDWGAVERSDAKDALAAAAANGSPSGPLPADGHLCAPDSVPLRPVPPPRSSLLPDPARALRSAALAAAHEGAVAELVGRPDEAELAYVRAEALLRFFADRVPQARRGKGGIDHVLRAVAERRKAAAEESGA